MISGRLAAIFAAVMLATHAQPAQPDQPVTGKDAFNEQCAPCHVKELQKAYVWLGPDLRGIFNSAAGKREGYEYSGAFRKFAPGVVWNQDTLDNWISHSQGLVPNSRMLVRIRDAEQRRIIIDYLKTYD